MRSISLLLDNGAYKEAKNAVRVMIIILISQNVLTPALKLNSLLLLIHAKIIRVEYVSRIVFGTYEHAGRKHGVD